MKLTTVLASVNNNRDYYLFIPKQIIFWKKFDIKFIKIGNTYIPYYPHINMHIEVKNVNSDRYIQLKIILLMDKLNVSQLKLI
jgi:hypothetical protein